MSHLFDRQLAVVLQRELEGVAFAGHANLLLGVLDLVVGADGHFTGLGVQRRHEGQRNEDDQALQYSGHGSLLSG